jgi:hypothetical protein
MDRYLELLALGKTAGFTPLIIVPDDMLCELLEMLLSEDESDSKTNADRRAAILAPSNRISGSELLHVRRQKFFSLGVGDSANLIGDFIECEPPNQFGSIADYTGKPFETIIIAQIPTDKPWELAAWVPMGGWNECPSPLEQVAVFKYWHEKFGALPAVVRGDTWEMYVEKPVASEDAAVELAWEQFSFCLDVVFQGAESINALASTLLNSHFWYFWWD